MTAAPAAERSVWLLAAPADEEILSALLRDLAARFAAPLFRPHLTLAGDIPGAGAPPPGFAAVAAGFAPLVETVAAVDTGPAYYRSLYARFAVTPSLATLRGRAHAAAGLDETDPFLPHVSLAYGIQDDAAKEAARRLVADRLAGRPVTFDRVAWVASSQAIPIADWTVLAVAPLG